MHDYLCRIFGHGRSRRHIHAEGADWVSDCARCGTRLTRLSPKLWVPSDEAQATAPETVTADEA